MKRTYILNIESGNPDLDLDLAVRRTVGWMSDNIDESGEHTLEITVATAEGQQVTAHWSDPGEVPDDERGFITRRYDVAYQILTGIDGSVVWSGNIAVDADYRAEAGRKAAAWVRENNSYYDDRIQPQVVITDIEENS